MANDECTYIYHYDAKCCIVMGMRTRTKKKRQLSGRERSQEACRIITSMSPRTSSALLFTMLNFLNFNSI